MAKPHHDDQRETCGSALLPFFNLHLSYLLNLSLVLVFSIVLFPLSAGAIKRENLKLSQQVLNQIQALLSEKAKRTPAQKKISSHLLHARKMRLGKAIAQGIQNLLSGVHIHSGDTTDIFIRADVSESVIGQLKGLGGTNIKSFPKHRAIHARVPLSQLEAIALLPQVQFIRPDDHAITNSHPLPTVTEGDMAHRGDLVRDAFGVDGTGVTIGVMSNGVDDLAHLQGAGDLPSTVTVLPGLEGAGSEGTAMLEIVHDLAPGANLLFATAWSIQEQFANNILALRDAGADIIVDDVFYFAEPPFMDGTIAQAVNDVTASGVLFFSSAGNSGNVNDNRSGVWEGDFRPMPIPGGLSHPSFNPGDMAHDFGGGIPTTQITRDPPNWIILWWSDPPGSSDNDYDLFLLDASGTTVLAASTSSQTGNQDPLEFIDSRGALNHLNAQLMVVRNNGAQDRYLHLNTHRGELSIATNGQTLGHAAAAAAFGVAAVNVATANGGAFIGGASNPVETFSSDGPRRIFFNPDGTEITPGNVSSTGGIVRQKPDVAAADGVSTSTPGFQPFFGTSAAAPHAAAIAALVMSADPSLTAPQVRQVLESTAMDIEAPGVDQDSGYGLLDAFAAVQSVMPSSQQYELTVGLSGNGSGTVQSNDGSIQCPGNCTQLYDEGTIVTLTATGTNGSVFTGWFGAGCSGTDSCLVTMNQIHSVTASFQGPQSLSITLDGSGSGSVSDNNSLSCTTNCVAFFDYGSQVTLHATADGGSVFVGWNGAGCSGSGVCTVIMDQAQNVTATFDTQGSPPQNTHTLIFRNGNSGYEGTVDTFIRGASPDRKRGNASVLSWNLNDDKSTLLRFDNIFGAGPGQIPVGASIQSATLTLEVFDGGTSADIYEAVVDWTENETFNSFGGEPGIQSNELGPLVSTSNGLINPGIFSVDVTQSLLAWAADPGTNRGWIFLPAGPNNVQIRSSEYREELQRPQLSVTYSVGPVNPVLTIDLVGSGSGEVSDGQGFSCISTCSQGYPQNSIVHLSATPAVGSTFLGWSGAGCSGTGTCVVTMDQAHTVTATFEGFQTLGVTLAGSGSGTVSDGGMLTCSGTCTQDYAYNTNVTLVATPAVGSTFLGWSGVGCSGTGSCVVTMDQAHTVTATFEGLQTLGVTLAGSGSGTVSDGGMLTCPGTCIQDYAYNTNVTLSATPAVGSTFLGWSGAGCSGTGSCVVMMDQAYTVTATFDVEAPPQASVTKTFRNGENDYSGTQDTLIRGAAPTKRRGSAPVISWNVNDEKSALLRFDDIFGPGTGQIPVGASIETATLILEVSNDGGAAEVYEVGVDWTENETFNTFGGDPGVQADELGNLVHPAVGTVNTGILILDVTASLQRWALDPQANKGWIFLPVLPNGVDLRSSEYGTVTARPQLSVTYTP